MNINPKVRSEINDATNSVFSKLIAVTENYSQLKQYFQIRKDDHE